MPASNRPPQSANGQSRFAANNAALPSGIASPISPEINTGAASPAPPAVNGRDGREWIEASDRLHGEECAGRDDEARVSRRDRPSAPVDFEIIELDKEYARPLVEENHYIGKCPGIKYSHGLCEESRLVGCVIYSIPASYTLCKGVCGPEYKQYVIELSRLVILTETPNAASFLVGRSLAALPDHIVVSYADCNTHVGHVGYVYQATNWLYTGQGNPEPLWLHPETGEVISYVRRHVESKAAKLGFVKAQLKQFKQVGKHRYVYFAGSRRFRRDARLSLNYDVLPYPKGETRRHTERLPPKVHPGTRGSPH